MTANETESRVVIRARAAGWERWGPAGLVAVAALAALVLYWPAVPVGLVSDDYSILGLADVRTVADLPRLVEPTPTWFYRPVQKVVFFASLRLFGPAGTPLHLFFLGLHILNGVLIWRIGASLRTSLGGAVAAAMFLLHWRLHEAVAWAAAGSEMLAATFALVCLLAYRRRQRGNAGWLVVAVGAYLLACLSKESAAALPAAIAALELFDGRGRAWWRRVLDVLPFALAALAFGWLQVSTGNRDEEDSLTRGGLAFGFAVQQVWVATDLLTAALPGGFGDSVALGPSLQPRWPVVGLLMVGLLAVVRSRLAPVATVLAVAFTVVYIPFIEAIEDRYTYLPTLAISLLIGGLVAVFADLLPWRPARLSIAGAAALLLILPGLPRLTERVSAWQAAGQAADRALATAQTQVPRPPNGAVLAFRDVPDTIRGAFVFRNGLTEAVRLRYDDRSLRAIRLTGDPPAGAIVVEVP